MEIGKQYKSSLFWGKTGLLTFYTEQIPLLSPKCLSPLNSPREALWD